jgi:hypothetical protein
VNLAVFESGCELLLEIDIISTWKAQEIIVDFKHPVPGLELKTA